MKLKHYEGDGRARFVTFCTARKLPILTNSKFRGAVIDAIAEMRRRYKFRFLGFVIMPDHVHLVLVPGKETGIGRLIGEIKRAAAANILNALKDKNSPLLKRLEVIRNGEIKYAVWMRRCYDHNCRTKESVIEKIRYCHGNPVKRGLVTDPAAWKWSSYRWYQGLDDSLLDIDIAE